MKKRRLIQLACLVFALVVLSGPVFALEDDPFVRGQNAFIIGPDGARHELGEGRSQFPQGSRVVSLEGGRVVVEYANGGATQLLGGNQILALNGGAMRGGASSNQPLQNGNQPTGNPSGKRPGNRPPGHRPPGHRPPGHRPPGHRPPHRPPISP